MKKLFIAFILLITTAVSAHAASIPKDIKAYIKKEVPASDIRFDGLVTMPYDAIYLPLFPALIKKPEKINIVKTYPENKRLKDAPNVIIFNNDFVLLKVLTDENGKKTIMKFDVPPPEIKTGLLPQDLLVPRGLVIPDNVKGIIGGLQIATSKDAGLKVKSELPQAVMASISHTKADLVKNIPQLKDKILYVITCYSKDIHVIPADKSAPTYALSQNSVPIDIKAVDNKFLLVTTFLNKSLDIISIADDAVIKQIELPTQPDEIILDLKNRKAYVSSGEGSCLYLIDLNTMLLKQKIQVNGMCEKFSLSDDGTKMLYSDKNTNEIWLLELDNDYTIKDVGQFPNVSKLAFSQNKIYLASRTKNHVAIVDYATMGLIDEFEVPEKPVDMLLYKNNLYILSALENIVYVIDTKTDNPVGTVFLNTKGFSTKIYRLAGTNLAIVTDTKAGKYSVLNLDKKQVIKTNPIDIPVSSLVVTNKVKKINK